MTLRRTLLLALSAACLSRPGQAQDELPLRIVVGRTPGGPADTLARGEMPIKGTGVTMD